MALLHNSPPSQPQSPPAAAAEAEDDGGGAQNRHHNRNRHRPMLQEDSDIDAIGGAPKRYLPLRHVYSATSPCVSASGSSNVISKKVRARKLLPADQFDHLADAKPSPPPSPPPLLQDQKPPLVIVYSRRKRRHRDSPPPNLPLKLQEPEGSENLDQLGRSSPAGETSNFGVGSSGVGNLIKKRRIGSSEVVKLGVDLSTLCRIDGPRLRDNRHNAANCSPQTKKRPSGSGCLKVSSALDSTKRWIRLSFDGVDPDTFIKLKCKVYWPLDGDWYCGRVAGYNSETKRHHVKYEDGDEEDLIILNEKVKFHVSRDDMKRLNLACGANTVDNDGLGYDEMVVLAASLEDNQDIETGDIIWAKLSGHAMWPAVVVDESLVGDRKGLNRTLIGRSVLVQFFGTHDFARVKQKQVISFLRGLLSYFHLKCKKPHFLQSLEEAKLYLSEQKLPRRMLQLQNGTTADDCESASAEDELSTDCDEDYGCNEEWRVNEEGHKQFPLQIGDLKVISLGKIAKYSEHFRVGKFICPEGYTAVRKFTSITDPSLHSLYTMEVLRVAELKTCPLFRVTSDNGKQFKGPTPSACWNKIYKRIRKLHNCLLGDSSSEGEAKRKFRSGSYMFGLSHPDIVKLIQEPSHLRLQLKLPSCNLSNGNYQHGPVGYRPVRVGWRDLDKCNVCHMDEEYENNLFLQCGKCRMMVHARCYGECEPVDERQWLCNLCRSGAPESTPVCCLCPVVGGAMKPTTDGRWCHLACAMWIPETCFSDIRRMEPIDGISRINKDRWKLLCSICGVSYGACIQCSKNSCYVAYHPLCARAAGLCVELEDEDRLHFASFEEDDEDQCIRLLSFCKKHRRPSNERSTADKCTGKKHARECSKYIPPSNPSGCARSEPYNHFGRRGRKAPEVLAAASLKGLFVENMPYIVSGCCQNESLSNPLPNGAVEGSVSSLFQQKFKASEFDDPKDILSMPEQYQLMLKTFRKRLAFGKSGIHGFGIFAKYPHRAGDMMIEYTGELVRPAIADRREHLIYNSLVGAGTYMFRIGEERVVDATRAGSIAHLINHSCEPNCYSRVVSINGNDHIIIFAKRDIRQWEELTYDYRFFSKDEQLVCCCGSQRCQGVVNDNEAGGQGERLCVPRTELIVVSESEMGDEPWET